MKKVTNRAISFLLLLLTIGCAKTNKKVFDYHSPFEVGDSVITIAIIPYGDFKSEWVDVVTGSLQNFYGIKTMLLPNGEIPDSCRKSYPERYNASSVLQYMNKVRPDYIKYMLGLTTHGIAIEKNGYTEYGILGLGTNPGPCCIVSTANMGMLDDQFKERLAKVCLHEMGHNFGLPHCDQKNPKCFMREGDGTIQTIDKEEKYLCKHCAGFLRKKGFRLKENS